MPLGFYYTRLAPSISARHNTAVAVLTSAAAALCIEGGMFISLSPSTSVFVAGMFSLPCGVIAAVIPIFGPVERIHFGLAVSCLACYCGWVFYAACTDDVFLGVLAGWSALAYAVQIAKVARARHSARATDHPPGEEEEGPTCPVCFSLLDSPLQLRCGHELCQTCAATASSHDIAECPLCRTSHALGVRDLRARFETFRAGYGHWRRGAARGARGQLAAVTAPAPKFGRVGFIKADSSLSHAIAGDLAVDLRPQPPASPIAETSPGGCPAPAKGPAGAPQ